MDRRIKGLVAATGGALALWTAWGVYVRRSAERVPWTTVRTFENVELRRYPPTAVAETTAEDTGTAFRRLFGYISGGNETSDEIEMTVPVRTRSESIPMTAPVRTDESDEDVTMSFYLPQEYDADTAPAPTHPKVSVRTVEERVVAVVSFSWYATADRVSSAERTLLSELRERDVETDGDPYLLQYDDPWTPPFMRRNEVAVDVA